MRLKYNAPTVLTFTFVCVGVMLLSLFFPVIRLWFVVLGRGSFNPASIRCWVTLFTHIAGHASWTHLVSNFGFILLIGPILEERCGSYRLLVMILITAGVTGLLNILFFDSALLGASGVVFMMILLASFTNFTAGEIPLTFILVLAIYLGGQIFSLFTPNNISEFAHIVGGFIGSLFGFFMRPAGAKKGSGTGDPVL